MIGAYHQLWRIEHAFRMSKHDLRARPVYHHKRESIHAHLAVVFAALAISHRIETQTGWTIKKFVRALRRYRTIKINTGSHTMTAEDHCPTRSAKHWPPSTRVRTSLAQVGSVEGLTPLSPLPIFMTLGWQCHSLTPPIRP